MSSTGMRCAGCGRTLSEHDPLLRCYPPKPNQSNTEHFEMNTHTQTRIASNDVEAAKKDNDEVDWFAAAMKEKLAKARAKGRGGWQTCPPEELSRMLREHVEKGDPVDVANFCMFLWSLEHGIAVTGESKAENFSMMPKGYAEHRAGFVNTPKGEEPASFVDVHSAADEARARVASSKGESHES